jgi:mono/diheme cytochrome c family protein
VLLGRVERDYPSGYRELAPTVTAEEAARRADVPLLPPLRAEKHAPHRRSQLSLYDGFDPSPLGGSSMNRFQNWTASLTVALLACGTVCFAQSDTQATYVSKCQPCHGAAGDADTPMGKKLGAAKFSSEDVVKSSDALLLATMKNGKGKMPPWGNKLTEAQLKDLLVYVRSLGAK